MKRYLFILLLVLCCSVSKAASTVILESNGKATTYSDLTTAVNAALDGDVIYLANNASYDCPKGLLIQRLIQLRGNGTPYINGDITISIDGMPEMQKPVLEGVCVSGKVLVMKSVTNFKLRHCQFETLQFGAAQPNGLIDRCYATRTLYLPPASENFYVRNSKINTLQSSSIDNNSVVFVNCNIYMIYCENMAGQFVNCLINSGYDRDKFPLKNSVLASCGWCDDYFRIDYSTTSSFNCLSRSSNVVSYYCDSYVDWTGDDNTLMGAQGGEHPFTLTPTVMPKVTSMSAYSSSNGIINVDVNATSNDTLNN